jgi:uncharacterized membrane protein YbhN (UPF0104 family)
MNQSNYLVLIALSTIFVLSPFTAFADTNTEGIIIWGIILSGIPVAIGLMLTYILLRKKRRQA